MTKDLKDLKETYVASGRHKKELQSRMKIDLEDREKLQWKLAVCINSFEETDGEFSSGIIGIVSGKFYMTTQTNVYDCLAIGKEQKIQFQVSLPDGFHETIPKRVIFAGKKLRNCAQMMVIIKQLMLGLSSVAY